MDVQVAARLFVSAVAGYAFLVALLRVTGNRTLAKMRAYDFIVTVALGTMLASTVLDPGVSLAEGALAIAALVGLQWAVAWLSARHGGFNTVVTSPPRLLFYDGRFLEREMLRARVTRDEVLAGMRSGGYAGVDEVLAVVLETDGELTVLPRGESTGASTLPA